MTDKDNRVRISLNSISDKINSELQEKIKGYSPETLYSLGKNSLNDLRYAQAEIIFNELEKRPSEFKSVANLYGDVTSTLITSQLQKNLERFDRNFKNENNILINYASERIVIQTIFCMNNSLVKYVNRTISKEDFFEVELLIDEIPFKEMDIPHREKFEEAYCGFKELSLKIFLGKL